MQGCMSAFSGSEPVKLSEGLQQLKNEHPPLLKMMDELIELTSEVERNDTKSAVFNELIAKVEAFFSELDPHSEREEGVLFIMMEAYIGKSGPLAVMEYEHDQAKRNINGFFELVKSADKLSEEQMEYGAGLIRDAANILFDHFAKEENVLFPMAERMLSDDEKEELKRKIAEI